MAKKINGITIAIGADTTGVTNGLKDIGKQSNAVNGELRDVERLLKLNPSNVELVAQKQQLLSKQVELTTNKLDGLKGAQADVDRQFSNGDIGEEQYRAFQREIVATEGRLEHYKQTLEEVESGSEEAGGSTKGLSGKFSELGGSIDKVGESVKGGVLMEAADQLSEIGDKIVEIGEDAKDFALETDESYGKLYATTNLSGQALEDLKGVAQEVFKSGVTDSIDEATEATATMKQAFGDLNDTDLSKLTSQVITLSKRTGTDVKENTRGAQQVMNAFGIDSQKAFDLIAAGYKDGLNSSEDFMDTLNEYSSVFSSAGFSAEDMFTILKNGMDNGAMNTDKVADAVKELGLKLNDLNTPVDTYFGAFSSGTQKMIQGLREGKNTSAEVSSAIVKDLKNMSQPEQKSALTAMGTQFEDLGTKAAISLFNIGSEFDNVKGKLDESTELLADGDWQGALNSFETALLPIGVDILNALLPVLEFFKNLTDTFNNLPGPVQTFIESFGGILAIVTLLTPVIAGIIALFSLFGTTIGVVMAVITAVIAVVSGLIAVIKNWGSVTDWLSSKWDGLGKWWNNFWGQFNSPVDAALKWIEQSIKTVTSFMFGSFDDKVNAIKDLFKFLKIKFPDIQIPHIPLPHFKMNGSFNPLKGKFPKIDVDWFAKGGILTKPTVFGQNGNSLMVGGEAGKEAVAPLSELMGYVEKAVANQIGTGGDEIHLHLTTYGAMPKETMDQIAEYMMYKLASLKKQKGFT